jgi:type IV secretion system protein TrbB
MSSSNVTLFQRRTDATLEQAFGVVVLNSLRDPHTTDVTKNCDGSVWVLKHGEAWRQIGTMSLEQALLAVSHQASAWGKTITQENPTLDGMFTLLPGVRAWLSIPPATVTACFCLRRHTSQVVPLQKFVEDAVMTGGMADVIRQAIHDHKNLIFSGATGSGKTTASNSCLGVVPSSERLVVIEDPPELQISSPNVVRLLAGESLSPTQAVRAAMRMRPDRIVLGECRGPEALDLLLAWNSGHSGGISTIHANSAAGALSKLLLYVSQSPFAPREIETLIGEAVDLVIHIDMTPRGRRVRELLFVDGFQNGKYQTRAI